ncbi:IS4 family transposase [Posidoniimonas polymericola]|nr:IS4 family transposase [Posidoniimonas polymericola]
MAGSKKPKIEEPDITGLKFFDKLAPLLKRLHDEGCERDRAGNRQLHYDQYCLLVLLHLFNPIVTSLRGVQQASELSKVQKKLGCARASLGSLSEATSVFDAERLKEIIGELGDQLQPLAQDPRLQDIQQTITLVDGTLLAALPKIMEASWRKASKGSGMVKWRLHTHFEVLRGVPTRIDVTPNGGGEHDERVVLEAALEADRLYVGDRGYAKFSLFNGIVAAGSSYVCRLRDNSVWEAVEPGRRDDDAGLNEVISDEVVRFPHAAASSRPDHPVRVVCVRINPHTSRGKYRGGSSGVDSDGVLRIATNLLDVPAETIALIFSGRWEIETFFRFFKHILGCRRLLSHDQNGIEIQTYCAIIASMLIALWTGRKPTLRTYEMICFYLCGMACEQELMTHLAKLKKQEA